MAWQDTPYVLLDLAPRALIPYDCWSIGHVRRPRKLERHQHELDAAIFSAYARKNVEIQLSWETGTLIVFIAAHGT
jgi:hypothetical protein